MSIFQSLWCPYGGKKTAANGAPKQLRLPPHPPRIRDMNRPELNLSQRLGRCKTKHASLQVNFGYNPAERAAGWSLIIAWSRQPGFVAIIIIEHTNRGADTEKEVIAEQPSG